MNGRRWDSDERREGIASGAAFSPNLQELADEMRDAGWVAEEPGVHLLPHLEAACTVPGSRRTIASWSLGDDGVVDVEAVWGGEWGAWGAIRAEVFSLLGSIAEPTSHVRQRMFEHRVEFEMATGTLSEGSPFTPHGHLIRLRVRPSEDIDGRDRRAPYPRAVSGSASGPARKEWSMAASDVKGTGTKEDPWVLKTPPGTSEYQMWKDEEADPPTLMCKVGTTTLSHQLRCLNDLQKMLEDHGDWMLLGSADEQKPAADGTVEAWARSETNPVGGWYGLKKGLRGRFGMYVPPLMEALGLAEVEHNPRNNRMRAL